MNELLPCPFCGEEAGIGTQYPNPPADPKQYIFINCVSCGAIMNPAHFNPESPEDDAEVIKRWNTRDQILRVRSRP